MSIEEMIIQEKELAKCKREEAYSWTKEGWEKAFKNLTLGQEQEIRLRREEMARMSIELAIGHEQIAGWLQELKERREKESRREEVIRDPDEPYAGGDITPREVYESTSRLIERIIELLPDIVDSVTANMPEAIEQYIESKIRNGKEEIK